MEDLNGQAHRNCAYVGVCTQKSLTLSLHTSIPQTPCGTGPCYCAGSDARIDPSTPNSNIVWNLRTREVPQGLPPKRQSRYLACTTKRFMPPHALHCPECRQLRLTWTIVTGRLVPPCMPGCVNKWRPWTDPIKNAKYRTEVGFSSVPLTGSFFGLGATRDIPSCRLKEQGFDGVVAAAVAVIVLYARAQGLQLQSEYYRCSLLPFLVSHG